MVRKHQVDAAAVDVERVTQVALAHGRTFDVPARPAAPERRVPCGAELLVPGLRFLPQRKVADRLLVIFVRCNSCPCPKASPIQTRQRAISGKAGDPEVHIALRDVRVPVLQQSTDHRDHVADVLGRPWIVLGSLCPQGRHVLEERAQVGLDVVANRRAGVHGLVEDPVVDVSDVHHMVHAVTADLQVTAQKVVKEERPQVADMREVPHRRTACIHAGVSRLERFEQVLRAGEGVVKL